MTPDVETSNGTEFFGELRYVEDLSAEEFDLVEQHRRSRERVAAIRAEHRVEADAIAESLRGTVWRTAQGVETPVSKMTPKHARNALRFAVKRVFQLQQEQAMAGDPPSFACPDDWPLIQALQERGCQEDSIVDKVRDHLSARRYRKEQQARRKR